MILLEFFENNYQEYQDVSADNSAPKWGESRKTKLTLGEINKMRKMHEVSAYERANDLKKIRRMYGAAAQGQPSL